MTISPPSNVKPTPLDLPVVLADGVDSLVLAIDVHWQDETFFNKLRELKQAAMGDEKDCPGIVRFGDDAAWLFGVKPHGRDGYEWILDSADYALRVGNWLKPKSRPGIMAQIRSEALWTLGPQDAVRRLLDVLTACKADLVQVKVSRIDLCVDVLLDASAWSLGLLDNIVSSAHIEAPYLYRRRLSGLAIGRGVVSCRMYDKPLEIATKSKKFWMYDIWKLEQVPPGCQVIRVEYQLRREAIKDLGFHTFMEVMDNLPAIWAYCTQKWLRVVNDRTKHHTQQKRLDWWQVVQTGLSGAGEAHPAIRAKSVSLNKQRIIAQLRGHIVAITALLREGELIQPDQVLDMEKHLKEAVDLLRSSGMDDQSFTEQVKRKQVKLIRQLEKYQQAVRARLGNGVCS